MNVEDDQRRQRQISLNPATDNPTSVTGTISTSAAGAALCAPSGTIWTVTNTGSIVSTNAAGNGVDFGSTNALFTNGQSSGGGGYVGAGGDGVRFSSGAGTVVNFGTIRGNSDGVGVYLGGGGAVTNAAAGYVGGGAYGVKVNGNAAAIISNAGTIAGTVGISVTGAGTLDQTLIDSGTIVGSGGTAAAFGAGNDLLKFTPSASVSIQGTVNGGGGTNTLEFASTASTGTLTGTGADFVNFSAGTIDSNASTTAPRWPAQSPRAAPGARRCRFFRPAATR